MRRKIVEKLLEVNEVITTTYSSVISLEGSEVFSVQCVIDVNTPSAKSFATSDVNTTDNTITEASHGYPTGLKGQFTTTTTLPAGLSLATDYFVIATTSGTYKVATSLANAQAGTAVDITDQGTGTHTFTPTSLAGATVSLQRSNDYGLVGASSATWDDITTATSITGDGRVWFEEGDVGAGGYGYIRLKYTLTAGMLSSNNYVIVKG